MHFVDPLTDPVFAVASRDAILEQLGWVPDQLRIGDLDAGPLEGRYDLIFTSSSVEARERLDAWLPMTRYAVVLASTPKGGLDGLPLVFYRELAAGQWAHVVRGGLVPSWVPYLPPEELVLPTSLQPSLADLDLRILVGGSLFMSSFAGDYFDAERIKTFGPPGTADIPYSLAEDTFADLLERLPEGWKPDVVLYLWPDYFAPPKGIEESPIPTVALVSDWNVSYSKLIGCLGMFDLVLADWLGCQIFRAAGLDGVHYAPLYSFEPDLHRPYEGPKSLDIAFLGNLNHRIQRQRTPFVARIVALSDDYKVFVGSGLYGQEYARTLGQARVVFNHSIRGELNLRCYEAPACNSLLFLERGNIEARWLLREGLDCVYYGPDDLESLLEHYLTHDAEREAIASSGYARVQQSSYTAHFSGILTLLRQYLDHPRPDRPFAALPLAERLRLAARLAIPSQQGDWYDYAVSELREAHRLDPTSGDILSDLAALLALRVNGDPDGAQGLEVEARSAFEEALRLLGEDPLLLLSYGAFLVSVHDTAAFAVFERAWRSEAVPVPRLAFHETYSTFNGEMERLCSQNSGRPRVLEQELRKLVRWQAATWLATGCIQPTDRVFWLERAIALCPTLHETRTQLGQALVDLEAFDDAIAHFQAALVDNPLDAKASCALISALVAVGDSQGAQRLTHWLARLTKGMSRPDPMSDDEEVEIEGLRASNFLCPLEEGSEAAVRTVESFVRRFSAADDVALVIYSLTLDPAMVAQQVEACLEDLASSRDDSPDVLVLDHMVTPAGERDLRSRFPLWDPAEG